MKRFFFWLLIGLAAFILFFIGLNLFDSRPESAMAGPLFVPANLQPGNGFFILWGFAEPLDSDPSAPAFRARMLELFSTPVRSRLFRSRYSHWLGSLNASFRENWQGSKLNFPRLPEDDACVFAAANRDCISEAQQRFAVPLQRYRQILQAENLADFTPLDWGFPARSAALAVTTAKLFAASRTLAAMDGDWDATAADLFAAIDTGLKLIACGRTMTVNALGKNMVEYSLRTLVSLLNRGDCPQPFRRRLLERLPARPACVFGTAAVRDFAWMSFAHALERIERDKIVDPYMLKDYFREPAAFFALERFVAISGRGFFATVHALAAFSIKKNESTAALRAFWQEVGRLEETMPASWPSGPRPLTRLAARLRLGPLWWLRNPLGKMMVRAAVPYTWPVLQHYVYRSHGLKVRYDLVRLLARASLQAGQGMNLGVDALQTLLASALERDPFSGGPYRFHFESGRIYSVGQDGQDDHGREIAASWRDSDIAVRIAFVSRD